MSRTRGAILLSFFHGAVDASRGAGEPKSKQRSKSPFEAVQHCCSALRYLGAGGVATDTRVLSSIAVQILQMPNNFPAQRQQF